MKIYELINTVNKDDHKRYFFVNLKIAKIFQKANPEFSIANRETLDELSGEIKMTDKIPFDLVRG